VTRSIQPVRTRRVSRRTGILLGLLAALVVLALAGGWWFERSGPILFWRTLQAQPEARCSYPGSTLLSAGGYNYRLGLDGPLSATYSQLCGYAGTDEAVIAFYLQRMAAAPGWHEAFSFTTYGERFSLAWSNDRYVLTFSLLDPTLYVGRGLPGPSYYQIRLRSEWPHQ